MIVYGKGYYITTAFGYIYFQEETSCEILWLIPFYETELGVTFALFDPHKTSRIVGIAESASNGNRLFYIENYKAIWYDGYQLTHKTPVLSYPILSFHLGNELDKIFWTTQDMIFATSAFNNYPVTS